MTMWDISHYNDTWTDGQLDTAELLYAMDRDGMKFSHLVRNRQIMLTYTGLKTVTLFQPALSWQIMPEKVTILAEACEWPENIDGARANEARIRAERRLSEGSAEVDVARAEAALHRALVRLSLVDGK